MRRVVDFNDAVAPALRMKQAGFVHEQPDFRIGPRKIQEFGFAFLYSGKGWVTQSGVRHTLSGGELFLIFPDTRYIIAAKNSRWKVYWVNFVSPTLSAELRRAGITSKHYLREDCDREKLKEIWEALLAADKEGSERNLFRSAARLWDILALMQNPARKERRRLSTPVDAARQYLDEHLTDRIQVSELARMTHLSRFHFIRLFRRETGHSPHQYQINQRLLAARRLLADGKSVKETAHALDYSDLFYFSRLFKRKTGVPPSQYVHRGLV